MDKCHPEFIEKRGLAYKVFALGFCYPKESLVSRLSTAQYWQDLSQLLHDIAPGSLEALTQQASVAIQSELSNNGLLGLEVEYNRLFQLSSTTPCAITASEYLPGEGRQALAVAQLRGFYKSFALRVRPNREADNLSVMLEFMSWLCAKELRAASVNNQERLEICLRAQQIMLEDYLGWLPLLRDTLHKSAKLTYYKWLSSCLCEFIKLERLRLLPVEIC